MKYDASIVRVVSLVLAAILLVAISRSLYNINDALRKNAAASPIGVPAPVEKAGGQNESEEEKKAKFSAGQLVIIKENENQFRIDKVDGGGDRVRYYSSKYERYYTEDEIEDFNAYWKNKK